jgi:hypothetical protein
LKQKAVGAHPRSVAHVAGQFAPPLQTKVVLQTVPVVNVVQAPLVVPPAATEHAWHVPVQAVRQQTPSKHPLFVASHSRQPATLQSPPAAVLQPCALPFRG